MIKVWQTGRDTVHVTGANGCTATATDSIQVLPVPPIPTITASGPTAFCEGGSVTLTASQGSNSYLWSNGERGREIIVSKPGNYTVTATGQNGCSSTSLPFAVSVYPSAAIVGASEECANAQATYSVNDSTTYKNAWEVTNGTIQSGQGTNTIIVQWGGAGNCAVSAIETTPLGCNDTVAMAVTIGTSLKPIIGVLGDTNLPPVTP